MKIQPLGIFFLPCAAINFSQCKFYFQGLHVGISKSSIMLNFFSFAFKRRLRKGVSVDTFRKARASAMS